MTFVPLFSRQWYVQKLYDESGCKGAASCACCSDLQAGCPHLSELVSPPVRSISARLEAAAETTARLARAAKTSPACGRSCGGRAVTVTSERSKGAAAARRASCSACSAESTSPAEQPSFAAGPAQRTCNPQRASPCQNVYHLQGEYGRSTAGKPKCREHVASTDLWQQTRPTAVFAVALGLGRHLCEPEPLEQQAPDSVPAGLSRPANTQYQPSVSAAYINSVKAARHNVCKGKVDLSCHLLDSGLSESLSA